MLSLKPATVLGALVVLLVLASSSGCFARSTAAESALISTSRSATQKLLVLYPLGERFALDEDMGADNNTKNPDKSSLGWEGWLALSIVAFVFFVFGAVFCFFGYKLFKLIVAVIGFIGGFLLGIVLVLTVASWFDVGDNQDIVDWVALGVGILFGIILAFVSWWFYIVGVFIVGGGVGAVLGYYIYLLGYSRIGSPDWLPEVLGWITAVVLFVILGFLTVKLQKFMIILGSAAIGAFLMLAGPWVLIEQAINKVYPDWTYWIFFGFFAVVWVAGVLSQYRFTALEDWHDESDIIERRSFV